MKYKYTHETGEVEYWTGAPSTRRTSNFVLLSHDEKVALGWELVTEPVISKSLAELKEDKLDQVRRQATHVINTTYPKFKRENAALGIYGAEYSIEVKSFITSVIEKVDEYDAIIFSANSATDLDFEVQF